MPETIKRRFKKYYIAREFIENFLSTGTIIPQTLVSSGFPKDAKIRYVELASPDFTTITVIVESQTFEEITLTVCNLPKFSEDFYFEDVPLAKEIWFKTLEPMAEETAPIIPG